MEQAFSKDYETFLEEFSSRKMTLYETLCASFESLVPFDPPNTQKIKEAIDFAHMNLTPRGPFALSIFFLILFPAFFFSLGYLVNILSFSYILLIMIFTVTIFWYLYSLPLTMATSFRIRASSEMVLAIVYMTIAMKIVPNIEYAIKFAATNLKGTLARDLKKIMWDVYTGKQVSMADALDPFMEKWKRENEEFTKAIFLIKSAFFESSERRDKMLNEAVNVVLNGTKDRMKHYAQDLKSPLTILNALGILLPIIGLVFFPIMSIFLPKLIRPISLVIGYNIMLPIVIYWLMKTYLEKRPSTFHQPDLSRHRAFRNKRNLLLLKIVSVALPVAIIAVSFWQITVWQATSDSLSKANQNCSACTTYLIAYALAITWAVAAGIIIYEIFSTIGKLKLRGEIVQIESELGEVLFQLGNQITRGMPIENSLKETLPRIGGLKISKMMEKILYNMETFGMTFTAAVFDKNAGAINEYPSTLIEAVMKAVTEISQGGMVVLSDTMLAIATYLKNMHDVEEDLNDLLEDVSSTMSLQGLLLAPMSAGIVVALTAMILRLINILRLQIQNVQGLFNSSGPLANIGTGIFQSFFYVKDSIQIQYFELIVGFYMLEVVTMVSIFTSIISNGDDKVMRNYNLGKLLLYSTLIYTGVLLLVYFAFVSLLPIEQLAKGV